MSQRKQWFALDFGSPRYYFWTGPIGLAYSDISPGLVVEARANPVDLATDGRLLMSQKAIDVLRPVLKPIDKTVRSFVTRFPDGDQPWYATNWGQWKDYSDSDLSEFDTYYLATGEPMITNVRRMRLDGRRTRGLHIVSQQPYVCYLVDQSFVDACRDNNLTGSFSFHELSTLDRNPEFDDPRWLNANNMCERYQQYLHDNHVTVETLRVAINALLGFGDGACHPEAPMEHSLEIEPEGDSDTHTLRVCRSLTESPPFLGQINCYLTYWFTYAGPPSKEFLGIGMYNDDNVADASALQRVLTSPALQTRGDATPTRIEFTCNDGD